MSFIGNLFGGGGGAQQSTPAAQTTFVREAPGIEERKIGLMDIARQVAQQPVTIPQQQILEEYNKIQKQFFRKLINKII